MVSNMAEKEYKSDTVITCPICGSKMDIADKMPSCEEDGSNKTIVFEYMCSNGQECGMQMYYPWQLEDVPESEEYDFS